MNKYCCRCDEAKPVAEFYTKKDGKLHTWCKTCCAARVRAAYIPVDPVTIARNRRRPRVRDDVAERLMAYVDWLTDKKGHPFQYPASNIHTLRNDWKKVQHLFTVKRKGIYIVSVDRNSKPFTYLKVHSGVFCSKM